MLNEKETTTTNSSSFYVKKGEYITIPHALHNLDPKAFKKPENFDPERFLVTKPDGTLDTDIGALRPYGEGTPTQTFAERECLALVTGVLMYWDIQPVNERTGWVIPRQISTSGVSLPAHDIRARIRRREFNWEA